MALQRQTNPLPNGRYWVDVFDGKAPADPGKNRNKRQLAQDWFSAFRQLGNVKVRATQSFAANPGGPARDWYLFEVVPGDAGTVAAVTGVGPTWDALNLGFPTIATDDIKSSDDTVQKPEVKQGLEGLGESLGVPGSEMKVVGALVALGLVTLLVLKFKK